MLVFLTSFATSSPYQARPLSHITERQSSQSLELPVTNLSTLNTPNETALKVPTPYIYFLRRTLPFYRSAVKDNVAVLKHIKGVHPGTPCIAGVPRLEMFFVNTTGTKNFIIEFGCSREYRIWKRVAWRPDIEPDLLKQPDMDLAEVEMDNMDLSKAWELISFRQTGLEDGDFALYNMSTKSFTGTVYEFSEQTVAAATVIFVETKTKNVKGPFKIPWPGNNSTSAIESNQINGLIESS